MPDVVLCTREKCKTWHPKADEHFPIWLCYITVEYATFSFCLACPKMADLWLWCA